MYLLELVVFLDILLGHMVVLFLVFWETSILFSTVAAPIYFPTYSVWGFPFPHIFANICYFVLFDDSHSDRCEFIVVLISLMISDVEYLFICLLVICISSLEKCLFSSSVHFLMRFFFWCWAIWAVYICWILTPYWSYNLQMSSPIQ